MTEQERVELLKRVVEVAPKEMGLIFNGPNDDDGNPTAEEWAWRYEVEFPETPVYYDGDLGRRSALLVLVDDLYDAQACFAMLDAMERAQDWMLSTHVEDGVRRYCVWKDWDDDYPAISGAASRAEAIARAFISCFSEDGS